MKITDVIDLMHPNYRPYLEAMMKRAGMNGESTVDDVMQLEAKTRDEELAKAALGGARNKRVTNKYGAKLDHTKHKEIVGLIHMGYSAQKVSEVYGVDRKTVVHMYSKQSNKYPILKAEVQSMGIEEIARVFVTPEVIANIEQFVAEAKEVSNKYANKLAGTHVVQGVDCEFKHRLVIVWCEPETHPVEVAGWHYKDLDGDMPESYFHCGPESLRTSNACYIAALNDISDPL